MYIIDLNDQKIEVTDLPAAIRQAEEFKGYRHVKEEFAELDKRLQAYWTDMYEKLCKLKTSNK